MGHTYHDNVRYVCERRLSKFYPGKKTVKNVPEGIRQNYSVTGTRICRQNQYKNSDAAIRNKEA